MSKVFISYRRVDSARYAGSLFDFLAAELGRKSVFMDIKAIDPGEEFAEVIQERLKRCDVLLALIGHKWLVTRSGRMRLDDPKDLVRQEIAAALRRKIRVIPVLLGDAKLPKKESLPKCIAPLLRKNAFRIGARSFKGDIGPLLSAIRKPIRRKLPQKITIVLADDHVTFTEGLEGLLRREKDFKVVATTTHGTDVEGLLRTCEPDVLLLDLVMPDVDGFSLIQELRRKRTKSRIVILTAHDDPITFERLRKARVDGIVFKSTAPQLLAQAIRAVYGGRTWIDEVSKARDKRGVLTIRERQLIEGVARGMSDREIASWIDSDELIVAREIRWICALLEVSDRSDLAFYTEHFINFRKGERERRLKRRFPIEQCVRYKMLYGKRIAETGTGKTLNVSSSGVWFSAETMLTSGMPVELSMNWPVLLNDSCPMKLMIYGCVVRSNDKGAAMAIEHYEFRTQGSLSFRQAGVAMPVEIRHPS